MASKEAECVDFMDFNEMPDVGRLMAAFHRPFLSTEKNVIYEDNNRNTQVLNEMHKFYLNGSLCDVVLDAGECLNFSNDFLPIVFSFVQLEQWIYYI